MMNNRCYVLTNNKNVNIDTSIDLKKKYTYELNPPRLCLP